MRVLAVRGSSSVLDSLGVIHALSGNVIEIPGQRLLVDEAAAHKFSFGAPGLCAVLRPVAAAISAAHPLDLVNALGIVLLGNLARITLGAWVKFRYGIDILTGTVHQVAGLLLFPTYIGIILSMDQLLAYLLNPIRRRRQQPGLVATVEVSSGWPDSAGDAPRLGASHGMRVRIAGFGEPGAGLGAS